MPTAYALVIVNTISIFICYKIAKDRGGNTRFWGWMGFFLVPLPSLLPISVKRKLNLTFERP